MLLYERNDRMLSKKINTGVYDSSRFFPAFSERFLGRAQTTSGCLWLGLQHLECVLKALREKVRTLRKLGRSTKGN